MLKLYHVSFSSVESFSPRIPPVRGNGEDATIPRICFSTDILSALRSLPDAGVVVNYMLNQLHVFPTLYIYELDTDMLYDYEWDSWKNVSKYVPDAADNYECWAYKKLDDVPVHKYEVKDAILLNVTDSDGMRGIYIEYVCIRSHKNAKSNERKFLDSFQLNEQQQQAFETLIINKSPQGIRLVITMASKGRLDCILKKK